jgi:hypothetical protein
MHRIALPFVFACAGLPAMAWEFTPDPICTLSHQGQDMTVTVTFDPMIEQYAIHLERDGGWPDAPVFSLRFEGPSGQVISTDRHAVGDVSPETLTVRDRGFGNVLNGIEFNSRAVAVLGDLEVPVSLDGAAPAVAAFRACPADKFVFVSEGTRTDNS